MRTINFLTAVLLLTGFIIAFATQGHSQPGQVRCGPTDLVQTDLSNRFSERPMFQFSNQGVPYLLWVNLDTGSWTITFEQDHRTCVMGSGIDARTTSLADLIRRGSH